MGTAPRIAFAVLVATVMAGCAGPADTVLVVRSELPDELTAQVEERFEASSPGVDVRFTTGDAASSLQELRAWSDEGEPDEPPPFDVWWGAPALALEQAADESLLAAYQPSWVQGDDDTPSQGDASWHPLLRTPFVIAFNRERLTIARAPTEWSDLFHFRWADELIVLDPARSEEGAYFAGSMITEALRDDDDLNRGFDWLARLDEQVRTYVADQGEAVRALRAGNGQLAILPRASVEIARGSGEAPWIHYRIPRSGAPALVRGIAVVDGTEVEVVARAFEELVGGAETATASLLATRWEPVFGQVQEDRLPRNFMLDLPWTPYVLSADTLVRELPGWLDRWDISVRAR